MANSRRTGVFHSRPMFNQKAQTIFQQLSKKQFMEVAIDLALGGTSFDETEPIDNVLDEIVNRAILLRTQKAYKLDWS